MKRSRASRRLGRPRAGCEGLSAPMTGSPIRVYVRTSDVVHAPAVVSVLSILFPFNKPAIHIDFISFPAKGWNVVPSSQFLPAADMFAVHPGALSVDSDLQTGASKIGNSQNLNKSLICEWPMPRRQTAIARQPSGGTERARGALGVKRGPLCPLKSAWASRAGSLREHPAASRS